MTALAIDAPGAVALTQLSGRYVPPEVKKVGSISSEGGGKWQNFHCILGHG